MSKSYHLNEIHFIRFWCLNDMPHLFESPPFGKSQGSWKNSLVRRSVIAQVLCSWGFIGPRPRISIKGEQVHRIRKKYIKVKCDTPRNVFMWYLKEWNLLTFSITDGCGAMFFNRAVLYILRALLAKSVIDFPYWWNAVFTSFLTDSGRLRLTRLTAEGRRSPAWMPRHPLLAVTSASISGIFDSRIFRAFRACMARKWRLVL